ncbi:TlpA family protein disulfide reductase [Pedobacter sp. AW31-3R]|uniref:TlpA family protein disulfide reductase n=1 Tax=Pedobacter sp. AW31-3R TaxID=3445781 RepID=UPI003F9ED488
MKKQLFAALFILLSFSSYGQQGKPRLTLQPTAPIAGKEINFSYDASGGDLEFSDEVNAALVIFRNFDWKQETLTLKKTNGSWTGKYALPENASFVAIKLYQGNIDQPDVIDNNAGKGFYSAVLSAKKKNIPGNYLAEAILSTPGAGNMMLATYSNPEKDAAKVEALLKKESQIAGSSVQNYLNTYLEIKKKNLGELAFRQFATATLQEILAQKNLTEEQLSTIHQYYDRDLKDSLQALKVENRIKGTFPKGATAKFIAFQHVTGEQDPARHLALGVQFLKDYPMAEWKKNPDDKSFIYYTIYRGLGSGYFDQKDYDQFLALFKEIDFKTANEIYRWNIMKAYMMKLVDVKILYGLSQKIIPYLLERKNDGSYKEDFGADHSAAQDNADQQMDDRLFTHISMTKDVADYANGKDYFLKLSQKGQYSNAELNEIHLYILDKLGEEKLILPLLDASMKNNAVTPVMFNKLKSIYLSTHNGSDKGYESYLASLKSKKENDEMMKHVKGNLVNHPLTPFTLEDANGKMVSSADWKDKIIVIDFWATWCRPCIMAFPGMQLLVDKYAKDPSVGVYMIGTMQHGDYKFKSVNYVKETGFRFNLLHDAIGDNGEQDKVFKSLVPLFNSSAIPRKIIVKNEVVRYSSEGYSGSPSQLMDELSTAIELLRAEK